MKLESLSSLEPDVRQLLPEFLRAGRERLLQLQQLLGENGFQDLRRLGHGLKGSGAMYELASFEHVGKQIEQAALQEDRPALTALFQELKVLLDELDVALAVEPGHS